MVKNKSERIVKYTNNIKYKIYDFIDKARNDFPHDDKKKIAQNIALNMLCQITRDISINYKNTFEEEFEKLIMDIMTWRDSYMEIRNKISTNENSTKVMGTLNDCKIN